MDDTDIVDIATMLRAPDRLEPHLCAAAADEIERLRVIMQGWEHSARNAERDIAELRAERNEARRLLCDEIWLSRGGRMSVDLIARERGWDCFKEDTNG